MRKLFKILIFSVVSIVVLFFIAKSVRTLSVVKERTEFETSHFIISYRGIYEHNAKEIGRELEGNYERIRSDLNDPEHNIIKVFIHPTQTEFNEETGLMNSTANGTSRGPNEFHFIWTNWYNSIFPDDPRKTAVHEFTHCVQLNILINDALETQANRDEEFFDENFERKFQETYPQWLWEAICIFEANEVNTISVKYGMRNNPSLESLNTSNQIYNVGYTIIEYLVKEHGKEKLPEFLKSYGDFESVLGVTEKAFETGWHKFTDENY